MRTAAEIIRDTFDNGSGDDLIADLYEKAINEARIEAIKECAERADTKRETDFSDDIGYYDYNVVDKESILQLINEIH